MLKPLAGAASTSWSTRFFDAIFFDGWIASEYRGVGVWREIGVKNGVKGLVKSILTLPLMGTIMLWLCEYWMEFKKVRCVFSVPALSYVKCVQVQYYVACTVL